MRDIELEMKIQKSLNEGNNVWVVGGPMRMSSSAIPGS